MEHTIEGRNYTAYMTSNHKGNRVYIEHNRRGEDLSGVFQINHNGTVEQVDGILENIPTSIGEEMKAEGFNIIL